MKRETLSQQLRRLIATAPKSRYVISRETGIDAATLCRFVQGKGGMLLPNLDKVCECLGLRLVADQPAGGNKGRSKKGG